MPDIFDSSANSTPPRELGLKAEDAQPAELSEPLEINVGTSTDVGEASTRIIRPVEEYSMVMRDENASNGGFHAFVPKPENVFFASQHAEEKVLLLLRQHPVTQLGWIFIVTFLGVLPFLFQSVGLLNFLPADYQFASLIGWYLLLFGYALESFLSWFYNVYIITDERIVDVDFSNLLYKNISSAKIEKIEDVTNEAKGILATVFNFGTVKIQTAGTMTEFDFVNVPQPAKVASFINELLVEEERERIEGRVN